MRARPLSRFLGVLYACVGVVFALSGLTTEGPPSARLPIVLLMGVFGLLLAGIGIRLTAGKVRVNTDGICYRRFIKVIRISRANIVDLEVALNRGMFRSQDALFVVLANGTRVPLTLIAAYRTSSGHDWLATNRDIAASVLAIT